MSLDARNSSGLVQQAAAQQTHQCRWSGTARPLPSPSRSDGTKHQGRRRSPGPIDANDEDVSARRRLEKLVPPPHGPGVAGRTLVRTTTAAGLLGVRLRPADRGPWVARLEAAIDGGVLPVSVDDPAGGARSRASSAWCPCRRRFTLDSRAGCSHC